MDANQFLDGHGADEFLDQKRDIADLLDDISGMLDRINAVLSSGSDHAEKTAKTLEKMLSVFKDKKASNAIADLAESMKAIKPKDVTVNVSPTPLTITPVMQVMERAAPQEYEVHVTYDHLDRVKSMRVVPAAGVVELADPGAGASTSKAMASMFPN